MRVDTGTERLLAEIEDGIGTVTFNDPARHNVLGRAMHDALWPLLEAWERDQRVRVVVMRGAGDRAFAAGEDIGGFAERDATDTGEGHAAPPRSSYGSWRLLSKPVIAMINGYCIGGGMLMALQADIRICSEGSTFAVPAARLGLGYPAFGVRAITRVAGPAVASDLLFTARRLTAAEALAAGLVNRCVPAANLESTVRETAGQIAANAPLTIAACKAAIRHEEDLAVESESTDVARLVRLANDSADFREGQAAFRDKRQPSFQGV